MNKYAIATVLLFASCPMSWATEQEKAAAACRAVMEKYDAEVASKLGKSTQTVKDCGSNRKPLKYWQCVADQISEGNEVDWSLSQC